MEAYMRIAVCNDKTTELIQFQNILESYKQQSLQQHINIFSFATYSELEKQMKKTKFDVYVLDATSDTQDGIKIGANIRKKDSKAAIIYVADDESKAFKAFSVYAVQYLIKPVKAEAMHEVMDKIIALSGDKTDRRISVKTKENTVALNYGNISFIECRSHVLHFHLADGSVVSSTHIRTSFEQAMSVILEDSRFIHPHKSYILNMDYIVSLTNQEFVMTDSSKMPIARKNYTVSKARYFAYLA